MLYAGGARLRHSIRGRARIIVERSLASEAFLAPSDLPCTRTLDGC